MIIKSLVTAEREEKAISGHEVTVNIIVAMSQNSMLFCIFPKKKQYTDKQQTEDEYMLGQSFITIFCLLFTSQICFVIAKAAFDADQIIQLFV